jgi:hypothetical protein
MCGVGGKFSTHSPGEASVIGTRTPIRNPIRAGKSGREERDGSCEYIARRQHDQGEQEALHRAAQLEGRASFQGFLLNLLGGSDLVVLAMKEANLRQPFANGLGLTSPGSVDSIPCRKKRHQRVQLVMSAAAPVPPSVPSEP